MTEHEFDELYWIDTALIAVRPLDHLATVELDVEIARANLREQFRGDADAPFRGGDQVVATVRCERCYWLQIKKSFVSAEGAQRYFAQAPVPAVDDIYDAGLLPPERSPALAHWQKTLADGAIRHLYLATLLNEIDVVCGRIVVRVPA